MGPLHLAAAIGCTNMAKLLLQNGADVNLVPPSQGGSFRNSPLHWAAHLGKLDMFKLLLAHGADLISLNQGQRTPLQLAHTTERSFNGFRRPPEVQFKYDPTMRQPDKRAAMLNLLEEAAAAVKQ